MTVDKGFMVFSKTDVDISYIESIWKIDPRKIESISGADLSSYAIALAQYLIYFTYQRNLIKAEQFRLNCYIDRRVSALMLEDTKKYKSKSSASDYIISINTDLLDYQSKLDAVHIELIHTEGIEKAVGELIATIKRELSRRENELFQTRMERKI